MKIQVLNSRNKPLINTKIQLQIRGKDSGYISFTTDEKGCFELANKYQGQRISLLTEVSSTNKGVAAADGVILTVDSSTLTTI